MLIAEFIEQYDRVFDKLGKIKCCTREQTKKLIEICQLINPDVDYGNPDTGYMNVVNIKDLRCSGVLYCKSI